MHWTVYLGIETNPTARFVELNPVGWKWAVDTDMRNILHTQIKPVEAPTQDVWNIARTAISPEISSDALLWSLIEFLNYSVGRYIKTLVHTPQGYVHHWPKRQTGKPKWVYSCENLDLHNIRFKPTSHPGPIIKSHISPDYLGFKKKFCGPSSLLITGYHCLKINKLEADELVTYSWTVSPECTWFSLHALTEVPFCRPNFICELQLPGCFELCTCPLAQKRATTKCNTVQGFWESAKI